MKSNDLFIEIQSKIKNSKVKKPLKYDNNNLNGSISNFNYDNYLKIKNTSIDEIKIEKIDDNKINDLKNGIDSFFKNYPVDNKDFEDFTKYISLYLTFILKKPLHPLNLKIKDEVFIFEKNNKYYCKFKKQYLEDENSVCKYCIAIDL
ncbi:DUF2115 family protein [Methanobrevibacter sp. DSM 116169]|uniref:DUF2115 family protein n=1 Tax=Methanobrevibacter sp. DSM 116169 TaxID=3242727 RepID=UPI0038FC96E6